MKYLLVFSITVFVLFSCNEEKNESLLSTKNVELDFDSCDCEDGVEVQEGKLKFVSEKHFFDVRSCLEECNEKFYATLDDHFGELNEEKYNQLFDDGTIDEWTIFNHFNTSLGINSRLDYELKIEDNWLKSGALEDEFPQNKISGLDQSTLSLFNKKGVLLIDREEINFKEELSAAREWCTPIGAGSQFFVNGNRRIRLTGTLGYVSVAIGSCITGNIVTYRQRNNGSWVRNRELLCVGSAVNVRRAPSGCEPLGTQGTGIKCSTFRRSSLSVSNCNFLGLQLWYKLPNANDGVVSGDSENVNGVLFW